MSTATAPAPHRIGRPPTGQREHVVEVTLFGDELAILDALLLQRGKRRGRATLFRDLLNREAEAAGIAVPRLAERMTREVAA